MKRGQGEEAVAASPVAVDDNCPRIILFGAREGDESVMSVSRIYYKDKEECLKLFDYIHKEQDDEEEKESDYHSIQHSVIDDVFDLLINASPEYGFDDEEEDSFKKERILRIKKKTSVDFFNSSTNEPICKIEPTSMKEVRKLGKVYIEQISYTGQFAGL